MTFIRSVPRVANGSAPVISMQEWHCAHVMAVQHMIDRTFSGASVDHNAHLLRSR